MWELPEDLKGKTNYKYIITVIDHFSKFTQSYLLNTKESLEVFSKIRNFIETFGPSKYLVTDNGRELKNKTLKQFCENNNIKLLHGLPYRPHSQGVVERVHQIIEKGLYAQKLELKNKYNLDYALREVIKNKNNSYSKIINSSPNEIFFKNLTAAEIKNINERMLQNQKYSNIYRNNFELNEKILINDNFKLEHKTIKRKNKKRGNWIINGIIIKIYSYNSFKVKISKNHKDILFKDDEYYINLTMIKKVNESVWKKINYENSKLSDNNENICYTNDDGNDSSNSNVYSSADNSSVSSSDFGINEEFYNSSK